jgi:uncharacterized protein
MKQLITTIAAVVLEVTTLAEPILIAAFKGNLASVQAELDKGVDVNTKDDLRGTTPLIWATTMGHEEIAELLLANGADVNAKNYGREGALNNATRGGYIEIVELLIASDAVINTKDYEEKTPLDRAIQYNHTKIADLLRKYGAKTSEELKALMPQLSFMRNPFGFTFNTLEGKMYRVESGIDLKKWNNLREIKGTGNEVKFIDVRRIYFPQHFYRVVIED